MFEWLSEQYIKLILNYQVLLGNPSGCGTVELLRLFTFTLLVVFALKLLVHLIVFQHLKHKFPNYTEDSHPQLIRIFHEAVAKVGLRRVPRFYQFKDERPLVFTIGSLKPAIFAAPKMVDKLDKSELEATLLHELIHIKRRDNLLIWFLEIFFVSIPILIVQVFALSFIFSVENSVLAILGSLLVLTIFKAVIWKRILYLRELSCDDFSVDKIKDPLILASSLVNVWRLGEKLPKYRWQTGLKFTQTLLPPRLKLEYRINRLLNYRRPRLKLLLGKVMRWAVLVFLILTVGFLWRFYAEYGHLDFGFKGLPTVHICGYLCGH